jgi:hypothetical protein
MVDMSPFGWIWTFWHNILAWLYPGVGMTDTLPVTVAMIAFLILFYIAFRYFLFERLMKDVENKDLIINKLSIVISVSFSILGVYLGWIPFVAAMFGVFFGIIAIVFMFILGFAVAGMAKTAHAEYAAVSADASKTRAAAMQTRSEGIGLVNSIYKTAKDDIEEIKDTRQLYNDIDQVNTTAREDLAAHLSILQAFHKLHELLPAIERDTQKGDARLLASYANALQAPHTALSAANNVFRFLRNKFENNFNKVRLDTDELRKKTTTLESLEKVDEKDFRKLEGDLNTHKLIITNLMNQLKNDATRVNDYNWAKQTVASLKSNLKILKDAEIRLTKLDKNKTKTMEDINKLVTGYEKEFKTVLDYERTVYPKIEAGLLAFNNGLSELMHSLPDPAQASASYAKARAMRKQQAELFSLVKISADKERMLIDLKPKFDAAIRADMTQLTTDYNADVQTYTDLKTKVTNINTTLATLGVSTAQIQAAAQPQAQARGKTGAGTARKARRAAPKKGRPNIHAKI